MRFKPLAAFAVVFTLLTACGGHSPGSDARVLNLFIWSDYLAPDTIPAFEKSTGIKAHVLNFDTNETLETQLLVGNSGFDVVLPSAPYFQRQIAAGAYRRLDRAQFHNLGNLDPVLMAIVAQYDPGNEHGVIYLWGTEGLAYNEARIHKFLPGVPIDSWSLIFDPVLAAKLAPCGIHVLDNPAGVARIVLKYLGRDPNAPSLADLDAVESTLRRIRPYIRSIDSSPYVAALANADICIALAYNGDAAQARDRAVDAGTGVRVGYAIPREGGIIWFDMIAIPNAAPNPRSAYAFLDYVMGARTMADVSNATRFANANAAATPWVQASILKDPVIYPTADERRRLFVQLTDDSDRARLLTRIWQRFKTGQ